MTSLRDKLSTAVNSAEADSSLFHNIVHGNDTTVVSTEGGQVPSVAKAIKDICATITNESNNIVEIAQTAAQTASEKAIICKESEKIVLENVKGSQNAKIWAEGTDGSLAGPYKVSAGEQSNEVVLEKLPDIEILTGSDVERTHFAFGIADKWSILARVTGIRPRSTQIEITATIEDSRVHSV